MCFQDYLAVMARTVLEKQIYVLQLDNYEKTNFYNWNNRHLNFPLNPLAPIIRKDYVEGMYIHRHFYINRILFSMAVIVPFICWVTVAS